MVTATNDVPCEMRILTVKQPWAWAIIHGGKDVENRSWSTKYRGPLAIHAGKAWAWAGVDRVERLTGAVIPPFGSGDQWDVQGAVIGVVDLVDVVTESDSPWADGSEFHWVLANPRPLPEPARITGGVGLRRLPGALADYFLQEAS